MYYFIYTPFPHFPLGKMKGGYLEKENYNYYSHNENQ